MRLDTSAWGEFKIGDLFELCKGTRLTKANMLEGDIRFVSAANVNNAITAHIGNNERIHSEGTITVCYNGNGGTGKAFYQDEPYWASDDVHVLYPKFHLPDDFKGVGWTGLNANVGLFLAAAIEKAGRQKYGFTDKWKLEYMREDKIKLPVKEDDTPDWEYIERYMEDVVDDAALRLQASSETLDNHTRILMDGWGDFRIDSLFDITLAKGDMKPQQLEAGDVPLVSAGGENNGIVMYCSEKGDGISEAFDAGLITVSMFGQAFYQPNRFYAVSHGRVNILKPKAPISEHVGLFVACLISCCLSDKFDYSTMCTAERLAAAHVALPQIGNGSPNWDYMESFMRGVMKQADSTLTALGSAVQE